MQKYIDNLDDFEDDSRSRLLEETERFNKICELGSQNLY